MLRDFPRIRFLVFVFIILFIFFLVKIFFLSTEDKHSDYFPDAIMVKSFKGKLDNDQFTQIVDKIEGNKIQIKQIDKNTNVVMIYDVSDDMIRLVYTLEENHQFKKDYITGLRENRNDIIIKSPLTIGTDWEDNMGGVYQIIEMDSIVSTPAGRFKTMVVAYNNDNFTVREYYAKKIGLVKIVINNYLVNELVDIKFED